MADLGWLYGRMVEAGARDAVIQGERIVQYPEFLALIDAARSELKARGVRPAQTVALVGDFDAPTCAMLVALIENDNIVTPLTPTSYKRHPEFLDVSEIQLEIHTQGASHSFKAANRTPKNPLNLQLVDAGKPGLVLYTSGSTGISKGAVHDFTRLLEKFLVKRPSLRTLTFLLLDHIGGVNTLLHTLANGGTVINTEDRHPSRVCAIIERHRVELLPVSPAFLHLLLLSGEHEHHDLSSLKVISYGTEPMPQSTLLRLADVFPAVTFQQTYGLTETGILRSKSRDNRSLFMRVGGEGVETKVVDGILWIRARSSMLGYLNAPSPIDAEGWLCTEDMVEVDGEFIRILGRRAEIINVGGAKVFPAEVESALLSLPNIGDAVVYAERHPLTGQMVVAAVQLLQPEPKLDLKRRIREALRDRIDVFKIPQKVVITDEAMFNERFKRMRLNRVRDGAAQ